MAPPSQSHTFTAWDEQIANRKTDFGALFTVMANASHSQEFYDDVELWWRLSLVTLKLAANIDMNTEKVSKIAKIIEAKGYAEQALNLAPNNFQANLWMAVAVGDLMLLQADLHARLLQLKLFYEHLRECMRTHADHWRVLLMEANMHLRLWYGRQEARALIRASPGLIPTGLSRLELHDVEKKLRRAMELKPDFLPIYWSLFTVLIKQKHTNEALDIGRKGLALDRTLLDEKQMAQQLERWMRSVGEAGTGRGGAEGQH